MPKDKAVSTTEQSQKPIIHPKAQMQQYLDTLIGQPLSRVWGSYGTLFLEFWDLIFKDDDHMKRYGWWEISLMIEPNRRFQKKGKVLENCMTVDSQDFEKKMKKYIGLKIVAIWGIAMGTLYELAIVFENWIEFYTFASCPWHKSHWSLFFRWADGESKSALNQQRLRKIVID